MGSRAASSAKVIAYASADGAAERARLAGQHEGRLRHRGQPARAKLVPGHIATFKQLNLEAGREQTVNFLIGDRERRSAHLGLVIVEAHKQGPCSWPQQ